MSVRTPLPIRLIKSRQVGRSTHKYKSIGATEPVMISNSQTEYDRFVSAYKPSALPYFARSQISQFTSSKELFTLPSLRAMRSNESVNNVHSRSDNTNSTNNNSSVQLFPQPSDEDNTDSLLSRVKDAYAPGLNPHYIALPIPSTLLLTHTPKVECNSSTSVPVTFKNDTTFNSTFNSSCESEEKDDHSCNGQAVHHTNNVMHHLQTQFNNLTESAIALSTPAGINQWTSRWKGLTLLASDVATTSVIRNCAAMKLVSTTYRVLCRLPEGVSWNITQHLQSANKCFAESNRVHHSTATDTVHNSGYVNDISTNKSFEENNQGDNNQHNVEKDIVSLMERKDSTSCFLNPYVNWFIAQKEKNDDSCVDKNEIPLYDIVTGSLPSDLVIEPLLSMCAIGSSSNVTTRASTSTTAKTTRIKFNTASPHVEYGFVNYERKTLRSHGSINCFLRSRASSVSREFIERVNQRRRLQGLFFPINNVETHKVESKDTTTIKKNNKTIQSNYSKVNSSSIDDDDIQTTRNNTENSFSHLGSNESNEHHPWLPESSLFALSLDVSSLTKLTRTSNSQRSFDDPITQLNVSQRGKHVAFDFRLLTIAPINSLHMKEKTLKDNNAHVDEHPTLSCHEHKNTVNMNLRHNKKNEVKRNGSNVDVEENSRITSSSSSSLEKLECCYALYEVTGMNLTPDEVAAVFAAQHFYVLNDYVNDVALAHSIADVAERIRSTSVARLAKSNLSLSAQHFIKNGSVEELVIVPLMQQPLVRAADCMTHQTHEQHELEEELELEKYERELEHTNSATKFNRKKENAETTNANQNDAKKVKESGAVLKENELNVHQPRHSSLHEQLLYEALHAHMSLPNNSHNYLHKCNEYNYCNEQRSSNNSNNTSNSNITINEKIVTRSKSLLHLLPLGSGVECVEIVFPDPTLHSNLLTLQRLYQEFQTSGDYTHNRGMTKAIESLVFVSHNIHNSRLTDGEDGICEVPMVLGATMQNFSYVRLIDNVQTREKNNNSIITSWNKDVVNNTVMRSEALPFPTLPSIECSISLAIPLLMNFTTWYGARWLVNKLCRVRTSESYEVQWQKWVRAVEQSMHITTTTTSTNAMSLLYFNWIWCIRDHLSCFLRLEELSEHTCALCHQQFHTWQSCPLHLRSSELFIQESINIANITTSKEEKQQSTSSTSSSSSSSSLEATESNEKTKENFDLITDGMTVHSIEDVAHELRITLINNNQNTNNTHYEYNNHLTLQKHNHKQSPYSQLSTVVSVPNKAVTYTSRQARYEQNNYYREQANRFKPRHQQPLKIIRCVYCGGRHHISECSKLDKQN